MKRTFLVILALVMALTLVMSSAGIVSAGKVSATGDVITISKVNTHNQTINYTVQWSGFETLPSAYTVEVTFIKYDGFWDNLCVLGETTYSFTQPTVTFSDRGRFKNTSTGVIISTDIVSAYVNFYDSNGTLLSGPSYSNDYLVP